MTVAAVTVAAAGNRGACNSVVWVHQIHAAGGVGGFITMVMVFGR